MYNLFEFNSYVGKVYYDIKMYYAKKKETTAYVYKQIFFFLIKKVEIGFIWSCTQYIHIHKYLFTIYYQAHIRFDFQFYV